MRALRITLAVSIFLSAAAATGINAAEIGSRCAGVPSIDEQTASAYAELALECTAREYPNKPGHVIGGEDEVLPPEDLHPAFYGCFDWHSSVHGHWLLVRLLGMFPRMPEAERIRERLDENLTSENIRAEVAYFEQDNRKSFERTYGWAWLLKLSEELMRSPEPKAAVWAANVEPLAELIARRYIDFLPRQTYPIRRGVHPNTAFGMAFALDYARESGMLELDKAITARALEYYSLDSGCPGDWEPDGDDFLSPCLTEADLMRRVLPPAQFGRWLEHFLPGLEKDRPATLLHPVEVSDRTDPKIVHLDGLNLSRAWCLFGIASVLEPGDSRKEVLERAACEHAAAGLSHVASGNYEGEHWLASFAVYLLTAER